MDNFTTFTNATTTPLPSVPEKAPATSPPSTGDSLIDSLSREELLANKAYAFNVKRRAAYYARLQYFTRLHAEERTKQLLLQRQRAATVRHQARSVLLGSAAGVPPKIVTESAPVGDMSIGDNTDTQVEHENLEEVGGENTDTITVGKSLHETPDGSATVFQLNRFFERPVAIYDDVYAVNVEQNIALPVWDLWSRDAAVRAKLNNYSFFRGDLHLRVSVSGTPFHYGRLMLSYQPYPRFNQVLQQYDLNNKLPLEKAYLSQAPGVYYINVMENEPVEIDIPFISYKQNFRLFNNAPTVITGATSFEDFAEAGEMRIVTLNPPRVANEDYDALLSINVYAWMTNVHLGCPTATDIDILAESKPVKSVKAKSYKATRDDAGRSQRWADSMADKPMYSGKGGFVSRFAQSLERAGDEYDTPGPVATAATAISKVGDALSDIPVIGPFATATSSIARTAGKIATWFGWSKPLVLEKASFVKNNPFSNGANLVGADTNLKITCDPKQELSVDPTLGGVEGNDDMAIQEIAARESYVYTFPWSRSDAAMTTSLFSMRVDPTAGAFEKLPPNYNVQPSACAFAVAPFRYWRGTMRIRFEVVCSKFHRGKLLFRYEPNLRQVALINAAPPTLNQQTSFILDLQEAQEVTFDVEWAHERAWARVSTSHGLYAPVYGNDGVQPEYYEFSNGFIDVRPINELVQPSDDSSVTINVYVSCPDLLVANPAREGLPSSRIFAESNVITLNETHASPDKIHLEHFGEKVLSFRSLLKRYVTTGYASTNVTATPGVAGALHVTGPTYLAAGLVPGSTASLSVEERTIASYLSPAYMAMRGGMRHRILPLYPTEGQQSLNGHVRVSLEGSYMPQFDPYTSATQTADTISGMRGGFRGRADVDGTVNFHVASNGGIEFETPFYSDNLFLFGGDEELGMYQASDYSRPFFHSWECAFLGFFPTGRYSFMIDTSTAEDFTFLRFQGAPFYSTLGN